MENIFLEVFNEGISPKEMNAVRGGAADPLCTCANGATYDCGCYSNCTCNGTGSNLSCSCQNKPAAYETIITPCNTNNKS